MTLPHRIAYEHPVVGEYPPWLQDVQPGQGLSVEKSRAELRAIYPEAPPNRNARKRQRRARRGK